MSIEDRVAKVVEIHLQVTPDKVTPSARFEADLGADSLDLAELVIGLEEEFELNIPDEKAEGFRTVGDAVTYIREALPDSADA